MLLFNPLLNEETTKMVRWAQGNLRNRVRQKDIRINLFLDANLVNAIQGTQL